MTDETPKRPVTPEGEGRSDERRRQDLPAADTAEDSVVKEALDRATAPVGQDVGE